MVIVGQLLVGDGICWALWYHLCWLRTWLGSQRPNPQHSCPHSWSAVAQKKDIQLLFGTALAKQSAPVSHGAKFVCRTNHISRTVQRCLQMHASDRCLSRSIWFPHWNDASSWQVLRQRHRPTLRPSLSGFLWQHRCLACKTITADKGPGDLF